MVNDQPHQPDRSAPSDRPDHADRSGATALPGLFADEGRVRAFAAVALGAGSAPDVARAAGLSAQETAAALRRLREQGVVTSSGDGGGLVVAHERFAELARAGRPAAETAGHTGPDDDRAGLIVRTFVKDGRLVRLPARWTRKKVVLRHIAEQTFVPGVEYPERAVDEKLRAWCDDGDVDHVTLRRYLVDLDHLRRSDGTYWRPGQSVRAGIA
ncbi:DUF2087 domain-containing protein [Streptomyces sp. M92]|uniref:DUF2087 domain-containing protein n=1 Tax=Streptomyces sp. M92 TaxID=2944250 RepID=UPI00234A979C|nr:DUF2087 domain-containing protein [Streptomyces sp. M92]WCN01360.1 DUF2087 domain-containing protein [Streptomyces sp. M92]